MQWFWFVGGGFLILLGILLGTTDMWRYTKTVYLITQVKPYEQIGSGAMSLLVLGDSTGYGTGASHSSGSVAGRIGQAYPTLSIKNDSVNGRRLKALLPIVSAWPAEYYKDIVLLQIGANDIMNQQSTQTSVGQLQEVIAALAPHSEHIILMTAGNIGNTPTFDTQQQVVLEALSREYYAAFEEIDESNENVSFINLFEEREDDVFLQDPERYIALDGLHPTSAGYALWFFKLQPTLAKLLADQ